MRGRDDRQVGGDGATSARLVDDVDGVVLAVRAGDPEEYREPAPGPETAFLRQRLREDELAPEELVIGSAPLRHAVHEHLERLLHRGRERYVPAFRHGREA